MKIRRFFAGKGQVDAEQVERVAEAVQNEEEPIDPGDLREKTDLSKTKLGTALKYLEEAGVVETLPTGEVTLNDQPSDINEAAELAVQAQERRQQVERSRLEMMRGYAEVRDCRREYLLNYFGEKLDRACGFCDNCEAGVTVEDESQKPFPLNSRVFHKSWGEGIVMRHEGDKILILFDQVGYKTLGVNIALQRGLLKRAG